MIQLLLYSLQPAVDDAGNILLWNGEIFGGDLHSANVTTPGPTENDTVAVLKALGEWRQAPATTERATEKATLRSLSEHIR